MSPASEGWEEALITDTGIETLSRYPLSEALLGPGGLSHAGHSDSSDDQGVPP